MNPQVPTLHLEYESLTKQLTELHTEPSLREREVLAESPTPRSFPDKTEELRCESEV